MSRVRIAFLWRFDACFLGVACRWKYIGHAPSVSTLMARRDRRRPESAHGKSQTVKFGPLTKAAS